MVTNVRLVHDFGGPEMVCPIEKRGNVLLIYFSDTAGWFHVNQQTGYVKGAKRETRWRVHPDDFKPWRQAAPPKKRLRSF